MDKRILQKIGAVGMILFLVVSGSGIMPVVRATSESQSEPQSQTDTEPEVISVQVVPGNVSMARGTSYAFSATVTGNNNPNTTVSWAVGGAKSSGTTIQSNGLLTVSGEETATTLTVTAISNQNSSVQGKAQVTLTGGNHTVSVQASPSDGGTVSGGGSVSLNGSCIVTASAKSGYLFTGWEMDGKIVSTSNTYTVTNVVADKALVANFKKNTMKVNLKVNHSSRGTVTGGGTIAYGGSMSLRATANDGYAFKNWTENGKSISTDKNTTLKNITSDRTITANFIVSDFDVYLSANPKDAGTLKGAGNYDNGKDVTVSAKANDEYTFVSWTEDNKIVSYKESYTIDDIDEDKTLVANFKKREAKTYTIEATVANEGGTISPSGKKSVTEGKNITYTFVPKEGYKILAVAVDNQQVGTNVSYTFENVKAAHTIVVAFAKKEAVVTPNVQTTPATQTSPNTTVAPAAQTSPNTTVTPATQTSPDTTANKPSSSQSTTNAGSTSSQTQQKPEQSASSTAKPETIIEGSEQNQDVDTDNAEPSENHETELQANASTDREETSQAGVLKTLNMSESEAKSLIASGRDRDLIRTACNHDYVQVNVQNDYAAEQQQSVHPDDEESVSVSNFYDVIQASFSEEEKLSAFKGETIQLAVNVSKASQTVSQKDQSLIEQAAGNTKGMQIGQYFDVTIQKSAKGKTESVTELSKEMELVLQIPQELKGKNREYCIIRSRQGSDGTISASVIRDMDDNADTITFRSDKFSAYAIAYVEQSGISTSQKQILVAVIFMVALTIMITVAYSLVNFIVQRKYRR